MNSCTSLRCIKAVFEKVAQEMMRGILKNRRRVATGIDGKLQALMQRLAPTFGYWLMSTAYRKIADPKLYARLDSLKIKV